MAISKETRYGIRCVYLPTYAIALPGVDPENPSDEQKAAYQAMIEDELRRQIMSVGTENAIRRANWPAGEEMPEYVKRDMVRAHYPSDDFLSEDIFALGDNGELVLLDSGSR
ncbi:hypothetical protein SEA_KRAMPUS_34 [Microbacterium phage Krampus]|uniref:Uncharacterized protein n=2 Tax=Krampusvirus krampus TaxID=2734242 RepID=A0A2Z4Q357_9CAUD|nr:hypothetical protein HOT40_gp34 [Microbacterium phage Krampus]AWY04490.1 hypothetical protein SEA_ANNASERENA_34 [Microbacterium phage AnnaSerena]UDG78654.1 hypothetical protein SEA_NEPTUNE_34 [Microbacterium phage Neptune]UDL15513.1 hypothetical protein SEA_CYBELE_34 [Microbacterium phage Cybele]URP21700.1 hypothetical protein SEA_KATE_34 [Microbacterium phage Kate]USH45232.1 hypothetical protein SEA_POTTY_34 [Microbacterium phage Potty]